jgi:hypothetical protein
MHQSFRDTRPTDAYGTFEFRARSKEAKRLVAFLHAEVLQSESRTRKRKEKDSMRFLETVDRFVGELLQAKAREGKGGTGRFGRAMSKRGFAHGIVGYENVVAVREGLKKLGYLIHTPGSPSYGPSFDVPGAFEQRKGEAAMFKATPALITLARQHGVTLSAVQRHFGLEHQPIEARTSSLSKREGKQQGRKVRFEHTAQTLEMERRVLAVDAFLKDFTIDGADHFMFYRLFNECDDPASYNWKKGGRLYSDSGTGRPSYQSMSSKPKKDRELRSKVTIDGEKLIELDLASSYLTIFHALAGKPLVLSPNEDPYGRIEAERDLVKGWMTISFGSGKPCQKWSQEFSSRYADEHGGVRPTRVCAAKTVGDMALKAYPLLRRIGDPGLRWADLMFVESEVILKAMETLRLQGVPSLPMHDALMVPASDAAAGARELYLSFYHVVGAVPVVKTKSELPGVRAGVDAVWEEVKNLEIRAPLINTRS